jgi:hypothetical protein
MTEGVGWAMPIAVPAASHFLARRLFLFSFILLLTVCMKKLTLV